MGEDFCVEKLGLLSVRMKKTDAILHLVKRSFLYYTAP